MDHFCVDLITFDQKGSIQKSDKSGILFLMAFKQEKVEKK